MNIAQPIGLLAGGRTRETIDNDINDELEFHIDCHVHELIQQGLTPELARDEAVRRFGDRQRIQKQCQKIDIGLRAWLTWLSMLALLASVVIIFCLANSLMAMRSQNAALLAELKTVPVVIEPAKKVISNSPVPAAIDPANQSQQISLKGSVVDDEGKPIAEARIFLIHKSWPNQRFLMETNDGETDEKGIFEFEDLYDKTGQNEFLVTVFAEGYEMKSDYVSLKPKRTAKSFKFKLKKAKTINFTVLGEDGKPLADTDIVLMSRKIGTREHMIYPASAEDAKTATDDDGKLKISYLQEGDTAKFGVFVFGDLNMIEHKVTAAAEQSIKLQKKR